MSVDRNSVSLIKLCIALSAALGGWAQPAHAAGPLRLCMNLLTGRIAAKNRCHWAETVVDAAAIAALAPAIEGKAGAQGPKGEKGDTGAAGPAGARGPQGPRGEKGAAGPAGPAGAGGAQGEKGDTGAAGAQGAQGLRGPTGAAGPSGPAGAQGPRGASGAPGAQGAPGLAQYERHSAKVVLAPGASGSGKAFCSDGKAVLGGGAQALKQPGRMQLQASSPLAESGRNGWLGRYLNNSGESAGFEVWAICAKIG